MVIMFPMDEMAERLRAARTKAGFSTAASACDAFGWTRSTYYTHENGRGLIPRDAAAKYAAAFRVDPSWLMYGSGLKMSHKPQLLDGPFQAVNIPVRGEVAAGKWLEFEDFDTERYPPIAAVAGRYPVQEQFSFKVFGPSMDKARIFDGDFVVCVPYWQARTAPTPGDLVVVERKRGQVFERTIKELQINKDHFELWPRSTDPRFQQPIKVPKASDLVETDGTIVEIVGLVIASVVPRG